MTDHTNMKPPPRLIDDPAVATDVQDGLAELASSQLPFDTAAGLSALQSALGSSAEIGAAATTVSTGITNSVLVAGGLALMLVSGGMYAWLAPRAKAPAKTDAVASAPAAPAAPIAAPAPAIEPEPAPMPVSAAKPDAPIKGGTATKEAPAPTALDREVALMVQAKALVHDKPRAALGLLQRLEREHPRGALSEERAGLRVLALWAAGERERARAEGEAFLARYPQSPMRERLLQLQDQP